MYGRGHYKEIPSNVFISLKLFAESMIWGFAFKFVDNRFNIMYATTEEFYYQSYLYKLFYIFFSFVGRRFQFYLVFR